MVNSSDIKNSSISLGFTSEIDKNGKIKNLVLIESSLVLNPKKLNWFKRIVLFFINIFKGIKIKWVI